MSRFCQRLELKGGSIHLPHIIGGPRKGEQEGEGGPAWTRMRNTCLLRQGPPSVSLALSLSLSLGRSEHNGVRSLKTCGARQFTARADGSPMSIHFSKLRSTSQIYSAFPGENGEVARRNDFKAHRQLGGFWMPICVTIGWTQLKRVAHVPIMPLLHGIYIYSMVSAVNLSCVDFFYIRFDIILYIYI